MQLRYKNNVIRWFATAAFLLVSANALAHEIDHALDYHNKPSCALHLFADHGANALISGTLLAPPILQTALLPVINEQSHACAVSLPFRSRAPPVSPV
jgi:hypothetical protein